MEEQKTQESIIVTEQDYRNTWFKSPKTLAEKILNKKAISCALTIPVRSKTVENTSDNNTNTTYTVKKTTIPFYMTDDFGLGDLVNEWDNLIPQDWTNTITQIAALLGASFNSTNEGQGFPQINLQSTVLSAKVWKGSTFGGFNVNCLFICTNRSIYPNEILKIIAASALPTKIRDYTGTNEQVEKLNEIVKGMQSGTESMANWFKQLLNNETADTAITNLTSTINGSLSNLGMTAPLYYGFKITDETADGIKLMDNSTLVLSVGNYFRAEELIVKNISNIKFSKELIAPYKSITKGSSALYDPTPDSMYQERYGYPLYVSCTLNLMPVHDITYEDFCNYFIDPWTISETTASLEVSAEIVGYDTGLNAT